MKLLIASDIHGSAYWCEELLKAYTKEAPDKLVLLGDLLYHGPRNDLPRDYAPKKVIEMLNPLHNCILCVRGNCEAEVDQMVLSFPVLADYAVLFADGLTFYLTHGHTYNEDKPLPMPKGGLLLCGHTHVPACNIHEAFTYLNPGSVSIPKNGSAHSYCLYENGVLRWMDLTGGETMRVSLIAE